VRLRTERADSFAAQLLGYWHYVTASGSTKLASAQQRTRFAERCWFLSAQ
jgi:hypothetical protein